MSGNDLSIDDENVPVNVERDLGTSMDIDSGDEKLTLDDHEIVAQTIENPETDLQLEDVAEGPTSNAMIIETLDIPDEKLDIGKSKERRHSCVMDLPPDSVPRMANQHSFKTTYSLTNDEIKHRKLNPHSERPSTRYRQSSVPNSRETINREGLPRPSQYRQTQNLSHSRESVDRSNLPGANRHLVTSVSQPAQPERNQSSRRATIPLSEPVQQQAPREQVWSFRMPVQPGRGAMGPAQNGRFVRWVNHDPFFHIDRIFAGMPGLFGFDRGFDDDGHFFFSVNIPRQREGPPEATNQQIEKAVSQLKEVSSELEIKKDDKCPICLDEFESKDDVVEMPCPCKRTFFHRQCAIQTLEKTKKIKCPNCRKWDGGS